MEVPHIILVSCLYEMSTKFPVGALPSGKLAWKARSCLGGEVSLSLRAAVQLGCHLIRCLAGPAFVGGGGCQKIVR